MRITDLIRCCDELNLRTTEFNNYGYRVCHFSKENDNIQILHCQIDMEEIITNTINYNEIICGFYENDKFDTGMLFYKLLELCEFRQVIYIIIDIENYYIVPEKNMQIKSYHKTINTSQWHSVSIILLPNADLYDIFYINSHGIGMCCENTFERKVSNTRIKEYKFNNHINFIFMSRFVERLQKYFGSNFVNPKFRSTIKLRYNKTKKHNYYGCNLQNGDFYGICFIFPLMIFHYFDKFYNKSRHFGNRNTIIIPPVSKMLNNNQLEKFVKSCFLDLSKNFERVLLFKNNNDINNFIEKKQTILVKQILCKLLHLVSQKHI